MKERELRERATCAVCRQKIGRSGLPLFYTVTIERHGVKLNAVQRQTGLEMMLGGHVGLAQALGPDEEMTERLMGPATITVCETCSIQDAMVAHLAELAERREDGR